MGTTVSPCLQDPKLEQHDHADDTEGRPLDDLLGGGLYAFTFQLNLSRVCHQKPTYTS
jgi:hypothetical protein